jgi:nitroimidazol reductase NimA-like FMN-containing flavoprotein (pyridoxamine 5'-phosphate oxidase superfamily)
MAHTAPSIRRGSAWSAREIESFLQQAAIPVRLACLAANGAPLICSLWYLYDEGAIWCATQQDARLVTWLRADPRCAFEVAGDDPPYRGVRGQGDAVLSAADGPAVLGRLIDRYLGTRDSGFARWLLSRQDGEVAIRIDPHWLTSWDFSRRMAS